MNDQNRAPSMWRERTDSSDLTEPRVLIRVFVPPGTLDASVDFYERLQGVRMDGRFAYPEADLALAMVGAFLIIEGDDAALAPYRSTTGTLIVDDVRPYYDRLAAAGAEIVSPLKRVPTGTGFNARHPDGTVVEYVHHRPTADGR